jgi:hypothetical protein
MTTRERARRLVRMHELTPGQTAGLRAERTLSLQGVPASWTCEAGGCLSAALYALRSALEVGGTKIEIQRGQHRHVFDVADVLAAKVRSYGIPPSTTGLPVNRGIMGQRASGNTFDTGRTQIVVPTNVSGLKPA